MSPASTAEPEPLAFVVDEGSAGGRVDSALAGLTGVSRSQIRRWIDDGRVRVDGARLAAATLLIVRRRNRRRERARG